MKEQVKPQKNLNDIEIRNLPDKEFKVMVIKMLTKLRRRMDEHSEDFNKETENIRKYKTEVTELENTVTKWKTGGVQQQTKAEERISDLEDRAVERTQKEQQVGKITLKSEDSLRKLWDMRWNNFHIIGVPEGEERERKRQKTYMKK